MFFDLVDKLPLHLFLKLFRFKNLTGVFGEDHIAASGVSLGASTMAENIKIKIKIYQPAPFNSRFSNKNQTRNCWQNWTSTAVRRQCLVKGVMSPCVNDIGVCTSPSTLYPGYQPGTIARQKAHFLGRSELAPPHLFCPPSFSGQSRGTWGDPHPGILNHGWLN